MAVIEKNAPTTQASAPAAGRPHVTPEPPDNWYESIIHKLKYFPLLRTFMYQFQFTYKWIYFAIGEKSFIKNASKTFSDWAQNKVGIVQGYDNAIYEFKDTLNGKPITYTQDINLGKFEAGKGWTNNEASAGNIVTTVYEHRTLKDGPLKTLFGKLPFTRDLNGMRPRKDPEAGQPKGEVKAYFWQKLPGRTSDPKIRSMLFARNLVNVVEAVVFTILTTLTLRTDRKDMVRDFAEAVGEETGKKPQDVKYADLKQSKNPFVIAEIKKQRKTYALRYITDVAFVWGVLTGVVLKMLAYPIEYVANQGGDLTVNLRKTVRDAQTNHLGSLGEGAIVIAMMHTLQQVTKDSKFAPLGAEEMEQFKNNVLTPLAKRITKLEAGVGDFYAVCRNLADPAARLSAASEKMQKRFGVEAVSKAPDVPVKNTAETTLWREKHEKMLQQKADAVPALP